MTMPHPQAQVLVDPGNKLLNQVPAQLDTGTIDTPDGVFGVLTVRTPSATLTVFLTPADVKNWSEVISGLSDQLAGGIVRASPLDLSLLTQLSKRGKRLPSR